MVSQEQQRIDRDYMQQALALARLASEQGEVPVGAIIVSDGAVIGRGANRPITTNDPTGHAEIIALREAGEALNNYRLTGSSLYVTLEPCIMCMGAIIHARIKRLIFSAYDPKTGAAGSLYSIGSDGLLNHQLEITGGVCQEESADLLQKFFKARRSNKS